MGVRSLKDLYGCLWSPPSHREPLCTKPWPSHDGEIACGHRAFPASLYSQKSSVNRFEKVQFWLLFEVIGKCFQPRPRINRPRMPNFLFILGLGFSKKLPSLESSPKTSPWSIPNNCLFNFWQDLLIYSIINSDVNLTALSNDFFYFFSSSNY